MSHNQKILKNLLSHWEKLQEAIWLIEHSYPTDLSTRILKLKLAQNQMQHAMNELTIIGDNHE